MWRYKRSFINYQDDLLEVKCIINENVVSEVDKLKEKYNADIVLRLDGQYYFCQTVSEVETPEDLPDVSLISDEIISKNDLEIHP
jgi:hypothetical protein